MPLPNGPVVTCQDVSLGYGRLTVLEHVDVSLELGAYVGVVGPNGAGKTTLLKALTGILRPLAGRITIARRPDGRLPRFGYVSQSSELDDSYPVSTLDVVLMGRTWHAGPFRPHRPADIAAAHQALARVGMDHLAQWPYRELSRGQQQRVLLARALAGDPDILCLDEPTNFLDPDAQVSFMDTLEEMRRNHQMTVLVVTHLLQSVANHADGVWLVHGGRVRVLSDPSQVQQELARVLGGGNGRLVEGVVA